MQRAAPGGRDGGVDGVPDKRVTQHHGTAWFLRRPVHQARGHRRFYRRAGRLDLRRLAQLGEGDAEVEDREHLEDDPGVRRQAPEAIADGSGQRPGQRQPARSLRIEAGLLAQHRAQVQRMPAGALVQPSDGLLVQRSRPEHGRQRRDLIRGQPAQRYLQPVLDARQHPLGRFVQAVAGPAVDQDGEYRVDRQPPQHEREGLRRLPVNPLQVIDHDGQRPRGQLLSDHLEQAAHPRRTTRWTRRSRPSARRPPAVLNNWSTIPKSRSASARLARACSTRKPAAPARQRRARAVFPTPGSPSTATSHGSPASTRATTSATRASSAARPTNTSSGTCRFCTRPPTLLVPSANPEQYEPNWLRTCCDRTTAGQVTRRHDAKAASTCAGFSGLDTKMVLWSRGKGVMFRAGPARITATPGRLPGGTGSGASRSPRWCWRSWSW